MSGRLSVRKIETAQQGKYEDGNGLRLVVSKKKAKKWVFRFTLAGRRREMGLGSYPAVSLSKARDLAFECRQDVALKIDPLEKRQIEQKKTPTFTTCAAMYIRAHRRGWANYKHRMQWVSTLQTYARPVIGAKPVDEVNTEDILKILQPIWNSKTETAKRVQGRIENILDFAAARKWRDPMNPARWRGHIDKLLPKPGRVKKVTHHSAMPYDDLPSFMAELRGNDCPSSKALQLLILTATRTGELIGATWDEIDLEAGIWTIPPERMKAKREHRIPLSDPALEIVDNIPRTVGNPYLFPGTKYGKHLSNMAMLQLMRGMGYGVKGERGPYVPHGFRSAFRDWAGETTAFPNHVLEMALAHTIKNKAEAAYRRGDLFEKRRALMGAWAGWCGKAQGVVVPLRAGVDDRTKG